MIKKTIANQDTAAEKPNRTHIFFCLLTIAVFFQYFAFGTRIQSVLAIIDDIMVLAAAFAVISTSAINKNLKIKGSPFDRYIFTLILIAVISIIINNSGLMPSLLGLKNYFLYVLLFYTILYIRMEEYNIKLIIHTIILCFLFQIPIVLYQVISILRQGGGFNLDSLYGSFPGSNNLSYASLFPVFLFLGIREFHMKSGYSKLIFLTLLGLLILGQGRMAIILFPLILFYLLIINPLKGHTGNFIKLLFFLVLLFILYSVVLAVDALKTLNIYYHFTEWEFKVGSGSQRYLYYPYVYNLLSSGGITKMLFGLGVGQFGSFSAFRYMTSYTRILANLWGQQDLGLDPGVSSQIIPIWGELGFAGLAVYLILLFKILRFASLAFKTFNDRLIKSLSASLIAGAILMLVGSFFAQVFEIQVISYPFWLSAALLIKAIKLKQEQGPKAVHNSQQKAD